MRTIVGILVFVYVAVIVATGLGFLLDGLNQWAAVVAFLMGLVGATLTAMRMPRLGTIHPTRGEWIMLGIFAVISFRAFWWLIFYDDDRLCISAANNLGDLPLHLLFIRYLAGGAAFWPESPILAGTPLVYPLGADLLNALIDLRGVDTFTGLIAVGLIGSVLIGFAVWRWGGWFTLAALLFNGGLAGFTLWQTGVFKDYQAELVWKNFYLSMIITQRGLLFALPAGLLLMHSWRNEFLRRGPRLIPVGVQFLLYAAMPLFNVHAFLFLSLALATIFLWTPSARVFLLRFVALAFLPASLGVWLVTGYFSGTSMLSLQPGWMIGEGGWLAWFMDFGFSVPLLIILGVVVWWQRDAEARCLVTLALGVFALCSVVSFAVWPWDNMKLILWSWLTAAPYLWSRVIVRQEWPLRVALCVVLFFSGAVSLIGGLDPKHAFGIGRKSELAAWSRALADVPPEDRIAIVPDFDHPVILLGRKVSCGYDGHLWSHGLPYREKYALLNSALRLQTPWIQAAPTLEASWLALRPGDYKKLERPDAARGAFGTLYDLRPFNSGDQNTPTDPPERPRSVD